MTEGSFTACRDWLRPWYNWRRGPSQSGGARPRETCQFPVPKIDSHRYRATVLYILQSRNFMSFTSKKSSFSLDRRPSETFHQLQAFLECQAVRSIQWSRRGWTTGAAHQPRLLRQTFLRPQLLPQSQRRSLWPRKKERSPSSPAAWGETDPAWLLPMLSGGACE